MAKPVKSQWDFGDLFSPAATRRVYSVAELTLTIKRLLQAQVGQVWVTGEISNVRSQASGHVYFTLKDAEAQLSCVLFRGDAPGQRDLLEDGQKVLLRGEITVYEPRGQYQLRVLAIELQGIGALQLAFERLKQKLVAEGLFAPERKRPLPKYPQCLGLVTSPTGAALRDVLHVIGRRQPSLKLILAPCRVQGEGAAEEIAAAIRLLNQWHTHQKVAKPSSVTPVSGGLDVILITRGGGSLEDLWAFNEEVVARAIVGSAVPVVSAVGHEIDFTISDFAADLRASTPSVAAELITAGAFASRRFLDEVLGRIQQRVRRRLDYAREICEHVAQRLALRHPRQRLNEDLQHLDDLQSQLRQSSRFRFHEFRARLANLAVRFHAIRPVRVIEIHHRRCQDLERRCRERLQFGIREWRNRLQQAEARLHLLSPAHVLRRGYSITRDAATGKVLRNAQETAPGKRLITRLHAGQVVSVVD